MIIIQNKKNISFLLIWIIISSMLNGCRGPCTEADDAGQGYTLNIDDQYTSRDQFNTLTPGENGYDPLYKQTIPWQETDLLTDGSPLVLEIEGMWTPWSGAEKTRICKNFKNVNVEGQSCKKVADDNQYQSNDIKSGSDTLCGAPCWFDKGFGVYLLFFKDQPTYRREVHKIEIDGSLTNTEKNNKIQALKIQYHPNSTKMRIENPIHPTVHLYSPTQRRFWSGDGSFRDINGKSITPGAGWKIFYKITSNYYGSFETSDLKIKFISGIYKGEPKRIFSKVYDLVATLFQNYAKQTFTGITKNPQYKNVLLASASLMIMFTGVGYITGTLGMSYSDIIVRLLKMGIIFMLLSPNSWDFFYNDFLNLFIDGVGELSGIIASSITSYNPDDPFGFIDYFFFVQFFSDTVWQIKIPAILTAQPAGGILWVLIIIVIFLLLAYMTIHVFSVYVAGMMVISFLVGLTPIFLITLLFSSLKDIFHGWLTSLVHNALQIVMLMAFLVFIFDIVKIHILKTVGFPTCNSKILTFTPCLSGCSDDICCSDISAMNGHHPGHKFYPFSLFKGDYSNTAGEKTVNINGKLLKTWYDLPFEIDDTMDIIPVPPHYVTKEKRYINLPYLDPNTESDRIKEILFQGKILDLKEASIVLLITVIAIFLKDAVIEVGQLVGGGDVIRDNLSATFANFGQRMASLGGRYNPFQMYYAAKQNIQDRIGRKADVVHEMVRKVASPLSIIPGVGMKTAMSQAKKIEKDNEGYLAKFQDMTGGKLEFLQKGIKKLTPFASGGLINTITHPRQTMKDAHNIGKLYSDHMKGINFLRDPSIRTNMIKDAIETYPGLSPEEELVAKTGTVSREPLSKTNIKKSEEEDEHIYDEIEDEHIYDEIEDDEHIYDEIPNRDDERIYDNASDEHIYDEIPSKKEEPTYDNAPSKKENKEDKELNKEDIYDELYRETKEQARKEEKKKAIEEVYDHLSHSKTKNKENEPEKGGKGLDLNKEEEIQKPKNDIQETTKQDKNDDKK